MNKYKKIATAVVATVMAGTMCFSVAGCNNKKNNNSTTEKYEKGYAPSLTEDGKLSYKSTTEIRANLGYKGDTTGIGYHATGELPMSATGAAGNSITLSSGKTYQKGELKPNFATIQENLGLKIKDVFTGKGTADQMTESKTQGFQNYDLIVANVANISTEAGEGNILDLSPYLDLMPNYKEYLNAGAIMQMSLLGNINTAKNTAAMYYAPYFDGYDDVERYVLARQDYVSELLDHADLSKATISFKKQAADKKGIGYKTDFDYVGTTASIEPYMGTTGSWTIETADPSDFTKVGVVKVNYGAVITELGNVNSELYKAVAAALPSGKTPQKESGNIVSIQNQMINDSVGEVTGAQLLKVLREYIKVAYEYSNTASGTYSKLYGNTVNGATTKLSDVFNGTYAAWDVDLLAALFRSYVTCGDLLGTYQGGEHAKYLFGFSPRAASTNRACDLWRFVAQLYGVRGLESKLNYSYIDASGNLRDARFNASTWEALDNFSAFFKEGLVASANSSNANDFYATNGSASTSSYYDGANHFQQLFSFDYAQTQTAPAYVFDGVPNSKTGNYLYSAADKAGGTLGTDYFVETTDGYLYAPVITPVSRWYVNDTSEAALNGTITHNYTSLDQNNVIMRFTESWRTVKTAGIFIPKAGVQNNPERLSATLAFIDYLYSNDGQIINTYGPMAANNNLTGSDAEGYTSDCGGFWYGTPVTAAELGVTGDVNDMAAMKAAGVVETFDGVQYSVTDAYASKAFAFGNKLYKGILYNGKQMPKITDAMIKSFYGMKVNGYTATSSAVGSYTSYAQMIVGTNLGFGEKFQSYEYQLTSSQGLAGETVVGSAIGNGTIKHVTFSIDKNNWWYTICPSGAPLSSSNNTTIKDYAEFTKLFTTGSSNYSTMLLLVGLFGLGDDGFAVTQIDTSYVVSGSKTTLDDPAAAVTYVSSKAPQYEAIYQLAWLALVNYYDVHIAG